MADWTALLSPPDLIRASTRLTELGFAREFGASPFLAISIRGAQDAVAAGLETTLSGAETTPARTLGGLGFHTEIASVQAFSGQGKAEIRRSEPDAKNLSQSLESGPHYLAALRKRADVDAAYADRISVGRAPNKDIVLRHGSISKFHAYFQVDDEDCYYLLDAGSKNGTTLNGTRLVAREPKQVEIGDRIVFGSIEALFINARALWRALHAA